MSARNKLLIGLCLALAFMAPAMADITYTQGSGTTIFDFTCFTTKHCSAHVPVNSAGTEIGTSGAPMRVDPTGSTTQPVSASALPLPTGSSTSANQTSELTKLDTLHTDLGTLNTTAGAALAAGTNRVGYTSDDPCTQKVKTNLPISQNGTSSVQLIALSGSTVIYVCSLSLIAAGATTVAITTGTGSACVTGNAAVIGSTTANIANSMSLAANGGLTLGNGAGTIAQGAASSELCMILGTSVFVSGNLTYVQQ